MDSRQLTRNTVPLELTPVPNGVLRDPTYGFGLGVAVKVETEGASVR